MGSQESRVLKPNPWDSDCSSITSSCVTGSEGQEFTFSVEDLGSIPGSGRSPGEGNGNPFQNSCLENPIDREAWGATVHGVAKVGHDW